MIMMIMIMILTIIHCSHGYQLQAMMNASGEWVLQDKSADFFGSQIPPAMKIGSDPVNCAPKEQLQPGAAVGLGLINEEFDYLAHEASRSSVEYNCDADG